MADVDRRPGPAAEAQLELLRSLLRRDYLSLADWDACVTDLAQMVKGGVQAQEAMVALWRPEEGGWRAVTSGGERLADAEISARATRSALERVRHTGKAEFTTGDQALDARSPSVYGRRIEGVLVVPLFFWDVTKERAQHVLGGCLYAHRTSQRAPFADEDVALVSDLARIAEPILNMLRYLARVEKDLDATQAELDRLRRGSPEDGLGSFRTKDPWMARHVLDPLRRAAAVDKVGILILGPTGSGKTHLAETYHHECPRRGNPFVVLNCGSFRSSTILGPELFGFAPDSGYSNAPRRGRPGKAELADGGTLFMDEIGCLPMDLQPQLLRLIEQGRFSPLGSSEERQVDLQLLAATNDDLGRQVRDGTFREDLYWRLSDVVVTMPSLSERVLDIDDLAASLLERALRKTRRKDVTGLTPAAVKALCAHDWARAGNVRGLEKTIERSVILAPAGTGRLDVKHLAFHPHGLDEGAGRAAAPSREIDRVKAAIREHGKATAAAKALGMSYRELYWKLQKAGLSVHRILLDRG